MLARGIRYGKRHDLSLFLFSFPCLFCFDSRDRSEDQLLPSLVLVFLPQYHSTEALSILPQLPTCRLRNTPAPRLTKKATQS